MRRLAWTILAIGLLGGCATVPPEPPDRFYRLGEPRVAPLPGTVLEEAVFVAALRSDGLHTERALLYSTDPGGRRLDRRRNDYWVDSPPRLVRDHLVRALRRLGVARRVHAEPRLPARWRLGGRLLRFEELRGDGGRVVDVALELTLLDERGGTVLFQREYARRVTVAGDETTSVVAAFDRALDGIARDLARDVKRAAMEKE